TARGMGGFCFRRGGPSLTLSPRSQGRCDGLLGVPCPRLCVGMGEHETCPWWLAFPCPRKAVGMAPSTTSRIGRSAGRLSWTAALRPDQEWEQTGKNTSAMVFSGGGWFDPQDGLFKMWYMGGILRSTCLATSQDGIKWVKPQLDVVQGTNVVHTGTRDSTTIW